MRNVILILLIIVFECNCNFFDSPAAALRLAPPAAELHRRSGLLVREAQSDAPQDHKPILGSYPVAPVPIPLDLANGNL